MLYLALLIENANIGLKAVEPRNIGSNFDIFNVFKVKRNTTLNYLYKILYRATT